MEKLIIQGGKPLHGHVNVSGAKNAALPLLCAALLTNEPVTLHNVPRLHDVRTMLQLLEFVGVNVAYDGETAQLQAKNIPHPQAPYDLVRSMRASILALGPLLARTGHAKVALPGGCAIGSRPVDQHIRGLQAMGVISAIEHGNIIAKIDPKHTRLQGARISTDMITVTGTENLLMAASLAQGETILTNAAQEPEVVDLAQMLIAMGARIEGHGSNLIKIQGVARLHGCEHSVMPDRIEAGTILCAVAACGGDVTIHKVNCKHLDAVLEKLRDMGVDITCQANSIRIVSPGAASAKLVAQSFRTSEYPGFPTDMQAQFMALNCVTNGSSTITETIFENRFMHVAELQRLGARIQADGKIAILEGGTQLSGASVNSTDLRASAALVIAGLVSQGQTFVGELQHLDRGYDSLEKKFCSLGADIERSSSNKNSLASEQ